jgi:hypothetical protein
MAIFLSMPARMLLPSRLPGPHRAQEQILSDRSPSNVTTRSSEIQGCEWPQIERLDAELVQTHSTIVDGIDGGGREA